MEKPNPAAREDRRPRPPCSGPADCRGCGAALRGVGPTPCGRLPPRRSLQRSARRSPAPSAAPGTQEAARLSAPGRLNADAAEHLPAAGRARPPPHALRAGAADSAWPGPAATHLLSAHPSVRPSWSRRCGQSVRQPRGCGATSRGGTVARRARRSTGGSRPAGAARGRAAAAEQAGKRSSSGAPRPRGGGTPCLVLGIPYKGPLLESASRPHNRSARPGESQPLGNSQLCRLFREGLSYV